MFLNINDVHDLYPEIVDACHQLAGCCPLDSNMSSTSQMMWNNALEELRYHIGNIQPIHYDGVLDIVQHYLGASSLNELNSWYYT